VEARSTSIGHIAALFEFFLRYPDRLPASYLEESAGQPLHRQVCDYIAGMTDGFFERTCTQMGVGN
jgi:dGTPase